MGCWHLDDLFRERGLRYSQQWQWRLPLRSYSLDAFAIAAMILIHQLFLHQTGPNNPLGLNKNTDKIPFHPYFTLKDIVGFAITIMALTLLTLKEPYILRDTDNFTPFSNTSTYSTRMIFPICIRNFTINHKWTRRSNRPYSLDPYKIRVKH